MYSEDYRYSRIRGVFDELSSTPSEVHYSLALNQETPTSLLTEIYKLTLCTPLSGSTPLPTSIRPIKGALASNPGTDKKILRRLSKDKDRFARLEVAMNPSSYGTRFFNRLLGDDSRIVRLGAFLNPEVSYEEMKTFPNPEVVLREVGNDMLYIFPTQRLHYNRRHSRLSDASVFNKIAVLSESVADLRSLHYSLRSALAFSPETSVELLEELYESTDGGDERTRFFLAMNPSTPEYILEDFVGRVGESLYSAMVSNPATTSRLLFKMHEIGLPNLNLLIGEHPKYTFNSFVEEFLKV